MTATTTDVGHQHRKTRHLIEEKMATLLKDSYYQPLNQSSNGVFFIDNMRFAVNVKILGQKLSIHPNSLNKDFRHHNIKCLKNFPINKITNLFDAKGWKIYQHSNSNFSLENVLNGTNRITSKWNRKIVKSSEKVKKTEIDEKVKEKENHNDSSMKMVFKVQKPSYNNDFQSFDEDIDNDNFGYFD